jgi:EAL domain-containing protein (putative c-di-GMP-specific phosphodiesterase class I)
MDVVAEGVEDAGQMQVLHRMGCEYLQGWLFGRPVDMGELTEVLAGFDPRVFDSAVAPEMDVPVH